MRRLVLLVGGTLAFWVLLAYPTTALWGGEALAQSATAMAVCLVPTTLTLLWAARSLGRSPSEQLALVMGSTGIRLAFVLGAGLLLYLTVPLCGRQSFWVWLVVFYLFTLAWEMILLLVTGVAAGDRK